MLKTIRRLSLFVLFILITGCYSTPKTAVRAAIDIGSGATKLRIAEVNIRENKIEKILFEDNFAVPYQEYLSRSKDNSFNSEIMDIGIEALKKCKAKAEEYNADKIIGVATASFRNAYNVREFIDKILKETDITIFVINQKLEGLLTFHAVTSQIEDDPSNVLVWDIGGGSLQFTSSDDDGNSIMFRGHKASIPFKNYIIEKIQNHDPLLYNSPNPMTKTEMIRAEKHAQIISSEVSQEIRDKISSPKTRIIGVGNIFIYRIYPLLNKKSPFLLSDLEKKIKTLKNKTDAELNGGPFANVAVSNPILILGFMKNLNIKKMEVMDVNTADGAFLYYDFW